jgi:hypothetical protein
MAVKLTAELVEGFVGSCLASKFDDPAKTPQFHRELWANCCSDARLVAVAAPRGHAKSTAVSLAYVLAAALFRNSQFIIIVSDTEGQAKDFLGDLKKELQTNEDLITLFGIREMTRDTETDIIVKLEDGYMFRIIAKGSEQKVRGLKWNHKRPDLIVCHEAGTGIYTPETGWIKNSDYPNAKEYHTHEAYKIEFEDGHTEVVSGEHRYLTNEGWKFAWMMKKNDFVEENISEDILNDILKDERNLLKNITIRQKLKKSLQTGLRTIILSIMMLKTTGPNRILNTVKVMLRDTAKRILVGWQHNVQNAEQRN